MMTQITAGLAAIYSCSPLIPAAIPTRSMPVSALCSHVRTYEVVTFGTSALKDLCGVQILDATTAPFAIGVCWLFRSCVTHCSFPNFALTPLSYQKTKQLPFGPGCTLRIWPANLTNHHKSITWAHYFRYPSLARWEPSRRQRLLAARSASPRVQVKDNSWPIGCPSAYYQYLASLAFKSCNCNSSIATRVGFSVRWSNPVQRASANPSFRL